MPDRATFALAACGPAAQTPTATPPSPAVAASTTPGTPAASAPAADTPAALRFTATTLDGAPFTGADLTGKPVVFWFWAPWCPKCVSEGPAVAKAAQTYRDEVAVVGIAGLDDSTRAMTAFVDRTGTGNLPHLDDRSGALYKHFRVTTQSSFLFMAPDGTTATATGPLDEAELTSLIDRHLR
ncbi:redoxin domain-containing protein [Actinoplanes sp. NPDC024001]|uniref:TlpA family protein disulfide reductase n=1 Tax=Actinoplanes sp. NPDC024001 TaxID=3154598 RepID=UPI0033EFBCF9